MIIDTHTHLLDEGHWPEEWWRWVAEDWARRGPNRTPEEVEGRIEAGLIDPDGSRMVSQMDHAGVDMSVLLPIDWGPGFNGTKPITQVVAQTLKLATHHSGRFIPFGGIDPRRPNAVELVSEWLEAGVRGIKLYPACGWDPMGEPARRVYEICERSRVPVLFHTGDPLPLLDRKLCDPSLLTNVARDYPDMPVWLGHAGAPDWWAEALELAGAFGNVRLELSVWVWDDSSDNHKDTVTKRIAEALNEVGASRLLFGSDNVSGKRVRGPEFQRSILTYFRELPTRLAASGITLTDEEHDGILGGNALRDLRGLRSKGGAL